MPPVPKTPIPRRRHYLREWRKLRDLSLEEAADRLDIHHATLSRIETSKLPYNQDFLEKCGLAYGCDPVDLLTINPLAPKTDEAIILRIRQASPELRQQMLVVIDALLKTGT